MKTIKEYEAMSIMEQENFIAHASADLVQKMYYGNDSKGLEVFMKNLMTIHERARSCLECLGILRRENDVCAKIYLLLEYMNERGINEEFISGLEDITEFAQEILTQASGSIPTEAERREIMKRLRNVLDRNDRQGLSIPAVSGTARTAEAGVTETAVAV